VLTHLLAGVDVEQAAKLSKVGERTVWRWLSDSEPFKRELRSRQRAAMDGATRKLQSAADEAIAALKRVMNDPEAPHGAVVSAARVVLETGYRNVELAEESESLAEVSRRLIALDERVTLNEGVARGRR
jgi:transposase